MTKALIIEDEKRAASRLQQLVGVCDSSIEIVGVLESVKASVDWLGKNDQPDLIFSDIQLADGLSFEIFEKMAVEAFIIFTTAYDQYAIRAFKANGIDYLLKPLDENELCAALEKYKKLSSPERNNIDTTALARALQQLKGYYKERFVVKVGDKLKNINTGAIRAFYSMDKATYLFTDESRNYAVDFSLDHLEDMLDPGQFFRVNRRYITSLDAIAEIVVWSGSRLKIKIRGIEDENLLVSRDRTNDFKKWLEG